MTIRVEHGDCRDVLASIDADSIEACVTDPPYHLGAPQGRSSRAPEGMYATMRTGFMGQTWDGGDVAFDPQTWRAVLRVLRPGAHLLAFGGTRTAHRMTCAIEDAGFVVRDTLCWLYGSGFPKSRNLDGEWRGWGTALKPAYEPIILARKPFRGTVAANALAHGTGAINVDACRVETSDNRARMNHARTNGTSFIVQHENRFIDPGGDGRWPANVVHDGSPEVEAAFAAFGERNNAPHGPGIVARGMFNVTAGHPGFTDTGSASRFFYSAKATAADRADSRHPTVKPVELMRWLVRLITPPGGTVLDPFAGSGTTGEAAMLEKFNAILIEADARHADDIRHRIERWSGLDAPLFAGGTQ